MPHHNAVIPAQAGIHADRYNPHVSNASQTWIPAYAGMTEKQRSSSINIPHHTTIIPAQACRTTMPSFPRRRESTPTDAPTFQKTSKTWIPAFARMTKKQRCSTIGIPRYNTVIQTTTFRTTIPLIPGKALGTTIPSFPGRHSAPQYRHSREGGNPI